ncbi:MAG: hypothetical protein J5787_09890 [Alphaproteobacteria bacterium]|nr:hypothetical protein [Alphaproteobacteria bacterium]
MYSEKKLFQYLFLIFFAVVTAYSIMIRASFYDDEGMPRSSDGFFKVIGEDLAGDYALFRLLEQKTPPQEAYRSEKISAFLNKKTHIDGTFFSFASPMKAFAAVPLLNVPYNNFFETWFLWGLGLFGVAMYSLFPLKKTLFLMFALPAAFLSFMTGGWGLFAAAAVVLALTLTEDYPKTAGFFAALCAVEPIVFIFIAAVFLIRHQKKAASVCIGMGLSLFILALFRYDMTAFKAAFSSAWRILTEKPCALTSFGAALICEGMPVPAALTLHVLSVVGIVFFGVRLFLKQSCSQAVQDTYLCAALCVISPFSVLGDYGLLYAGIAFLLLDSERRGNLKGDILFIFLAFSSIYIEPFFVKWTGFSVQMFLSFLLLEVSYRRSY